MWHEPEHRSIVVIDTAGSARWSNPAQLRARTVLRDAVGTALAGAGITPAEVAVEDRGDGLILFVVAAVSKVRLLDRFVPRLAEEIHAHNAIVVTGFRIRLRVAIHAGEVHRDAHGWAGQDLNTACRLVNGEPLYERLAHLESDLALVVSDLIYQGVVRHHYGAVDPAGYTRIPVCAKEVRTHAWLHTPAVAALSARSQAGRENMVPLGAG